MPLAKIIAPNATICSSALHLNFKQKSQTKFVKVFAKTLPSKEQNFPHFPLLVKGEIFT
ncbi:MAG: hypothetical protein LBJ95_02565 [Oscillospiraceae bacterium]|jgi:hypothetical protein|nr:hypothetical protein [Oscillospiraceae bacterium]